MVLTNPTGSGRPYMGVLKLSITFLVTRGEVARGDTLGGNVEARGGHAWHTGRARATDDDNNTTAELTKPHVRTRYGRREVSSDFLFNY